MAGGCDRIRTVSVVDACSSKTLRKILREAERQGFKIRITGRNHFFVTKDGKPITTFAGTEGTNRSTTNGIKAMQRAGFQYDGNY